MTVRGRIRPSLAVLVLMQAILLYDVARHDPLVGYDCKAHLRYLRVVSRLQLPTPAQTREFFSPPLPYLLPALPHAAGAVSFEAATKLAQFLNWLYSLALALCVLGVCARIRPRDERLRLWALAFLAMLPAYYRSFSFVRGEPLLALLATAAVLQALRVLDPTAEKPRHGVLLLGLLLGLAMLSRQWAVSLFPALAAFTLLGLRGRAEQWRARFAAVVAAFTTAAVVGGWFYLHLYLQHGTPVAFNRSPAPQFSLRNQPRSFYFDLALDRLFVDPVRPALANLPIPTLYADLWGDYNSYFLVRGRDLRSGRHVKDARLRRLSRRSPPPAWLDSNLPRIAPLLRRAMVVALLPSAVFLLGWCLGVGSLVRPWIPGEEGSRNAGLALCVLLIASSALVYFAFLIQYPQPKKADTIKATYLLHAFPFAAVLAAEAMVRLQRRSALLYRLVAAALALAAAHNLPLLFTRYPQAPP